MRVAARSTKRAKPRVVDKTSMELQQMGKHISSSQEMEATRDMATLRACISSDSEEIFYDSAQRKGLVVNHLRLPNTLGAALIFSANSIVGSGGTENLCESSNKALKEPFNE